MHRTPQASSQSVVRGQHWPWTTYLSMISSLCIQNCTWNISGHAVLTFMDKQVYSCPGSMTSWQTGRKKWHHLILPPGFAKQPFRNGITLFGKQSSIFRVQTQKYSYIFNMESYLHVTLMHKKGCESKVHTQSTHYILWMNVCMNEWMNLYWHKYFFSCLDCCFNFWNHEN